MGVASAGARVDPRAVRNVGMDGDAGFLVARSARRGMDVRPSRGQWSGPHPLAVVSRSWTVCLRGSWRCGRRGWGDLARRRREMWLVRAAIAWRADCVPCERVGSTRRGAAGWFDGLASTRRKTSLDEAGGRVLVALFCVGWAKGDALTGASRSTSADLRVLPVLSSVELAAGPGLASQGGESQWLSP